MIDDDIDLIWDFFLSLPQIFSGPWKVTMVPPHKGSPPLTLNVTSWSVAFNQYVLRDVIKTSKSVAVYLNLTAKSVEGRKTSEEEYVKAKVVTKNIRGCSGQGNELRLPLRRGNGNFENN